MRYKHSHLSTCEDAVPAKVEVYETFLLCWAIASFFLVVRLGACQTTPTLLRPKITSFPSLVAVISCSMYTALSIIRTVWDQAKAFG